MSDFTLKLRDEINKAQERRSALTLRKISYVAATFGVGALTKMNDSSTAILFLAPVMSFAFDLYIAGEDFGIKRAGGFLRRPISGTTKEEIAWEELVKEYSDPFSKVANPFLSFVTLIVASVVLWPEFNNHPLYLPWMILNLVMISVVWLSSHYKNKAVKEFEKAIEKAGDETSETKE
jgi:hypothetical protein